MPYRMIGRNPLPYRLAIPQYSMKERAQKEYQKIHTLTSNPIKLKDISKDNIDNKKPPSLYTLWRLPFEMLSFPLVHLYFFEGYSGHPPSLK